ncbi:MAG: AMP-binding protein [Candidatus Enteromonas sp.]|nr:AMP-binding protein [Candidatus Enteromonas sp.]
MKKATPEQVAEFIGATKTFGENAKTMEDIYRAIVTRDPEAYAYIHFDDNGKAKKKTYEHFRDEVFKLASKLSVAFSSLPPEAIIAIKLKNSPRWPMVFWAILMNHRIPLLLDARLPKENADNILSQASAKGVICEDDTEFICPTFRLSDVMNSEPDYTFQPDWADSCIFCSSGTTGPAKLMIYHGHNFVAQIVASLNIPGRSVDLMYPGKLNVLAMLPYHHVFGFMVVYLWFNFYGACVVYPNSMATSDLLHACQEGECTHVFSVPMFWDGVAQAVKRLVAGMKPSRRDLFSKLIAYHTHKISKKEAGGGASKMVLRIFQKKTLGKHIRFCISGGGFLSPKTASVINGLGFPLYNGFGMTEVGITSVEQSIRVEQRLKCSIGKPFYGIDYLIKKTNPESDSGELWIRSPIIHEEEIINGVRRKTELDENGFFPTGDIATVDLNGNYFLKGRIKDTIILSNGENVFPDEIEYYFKDVKNLNNVVCLGAVHPGDSEEKITLVCEVDNSVSEERIAQIYSDIKAINQTLPSEKKVQVILIDKRPLPVSGSMKVKRFAIRKAIQEGSKDFYNAEAPKVEVVSFDGYDPEMVASTIKGVKGVFSRILSLPDYKIDNDAIWNNDLGGDSMSYIELCQDLNDEFDVDIPQELWGKLGSVNDFTKEILDLLVAKGVSASKKGKKAKK